MSEWISVKDRLPRAETKVTVCAERRYNGKAHHVETVAMYEDGKVHREDSIVCWDYDTFSPDDYDDESDDYIVPEGWWEYMEYAHDEWTCIAIDDVVTHWMPLPEPPKEDVGE